jgi:hypothetical protein
MAASLEVLVDYNNVREVDRRKGVVFVVERVMQSLGIRHTADARRITVRLYDGWYERMTLTRKAQDVAAEVEKNTPMTITVGDGVEQIKVVVKTELAYSLKSAPTQRI